MTAPHPQPVVDRMIALAARGWGGSRIANEIGGGVSRCAVLAALWRRGIHPAKTIVRKPRTKKAIAQPAGIGTPASVKLTAVAPVAAAVTIPECAPSSLYELPETGCHFPIGSEGRSTLFCAAARAGHPSYCPDHKSLN